MTGYGRACGVGLVGGRAHGAAEDRATLCASAVRSESERADGKRHRRDSKTSSSPRRVQHANGQCLRSTGGSASVSLPSGRDQTYGLDTGRLGNVSCCSHLDCGGAARFPPRIRQDMHAKHDGGLTMVDYSGGRGGEGGGKGVWMGGGKVMDGDKVVDGRERLTSAVRGAMLALVCLSERCRARTGAPGGP